MNEKEKRQLGILYDANHDPELLKEMMRCKEKCMQFNQTMDISYLHEILGSCGQDVTILPSFWCDYGYNIEIGNHVFINHNTVILDPGRVKIGNHCFIGPNCGFYTAGHPFEESLRNQGLEYAKPIEIKDNVWIGGNVVICPGVIIGENSIIGAGSVVTKSIPDHVVAIGNPCRVIRENKEVLV